MAQSSFYSTNGRMTEKIGQGDLYTKIVQSTSLRHIKYITILFTSWCHNFLKIGQTSLWPIWAIF